MATAKRVPQTAKYERVETPSVVQYWKVLTTDGVETRRDAMSPPVTNTFVSHKYCPQPDRIVLEMSVEEAETLLTVVGVVGGMPDTPRCHTEAIHDALLALRLRWAASAALGLQGDLTFSKPLSPTTGTQTSPLKDVACGALVDAYKIMGLGGLGNR